MPFAAPQSIGAEYSSALQAAATNYGAFTVRQDYMDIIGDYMYRGCPFWTLLRKEEANADLIQEILTQTRPAGGFVDKNALTEANITKNENYNGADLGDPGQRIKAYAGSVGWSNYARSLHTQQGKPWRDAVVEDTDQLMEQSCLDIEETLITGDAGAEPLKFNGIQSQMPVDDPAGQPDHQFTASVIGAEPDNIGQKLAEFITRITVQRRKRRKISMIWTSGCGFNLLQREIEEKRLLTQLTEVLPGLQVPGIMTPNGVVPIMMSPHFDDTAPDGTNPGSIHFWPVDMDKLCWKGVIPLGGTPGNFEPQMFEVTQFIAGEYLVERRMLLHYGTLYAKDRGDGIFKMSVSAPDELIWYQGPNTNQTAP